MKTGNGLHNVAYALELLDAVSSRCREAVEALETNKSCAGYFASRPCHPYMRRLTAFQGAVGLLAHYQM